MTISHRLRAQMLELCGSICDDDGLDPRKTHTPSQERNRDKEYRRLRLCQQVAQTLSLVLPESASEPLRGLQIQRVSPGKNAATLSVIIDLPPGMDYDAQSLVLDLLKQQEGWLRSEVASTITRKRVPRFSFEFATSAVFDQESQHD